MRGVVILAVSVVLHAAILLALPGAEVRLIPRAPDEPVADEIEVTPVTTPPPDDVVPIQLLTLPSASAPAPADAAAAAPSSGPPTRGGATIHAIDTGTSGVAATVGPAEPGPPDDTGALAMREARKQGTGAVLGLPGDSKVLQEILDRPPREEPTPSGALEPNRDGTYTSHDLTFTAQFDQDGNITSIEDKPNFHMHFHLVPHPIRMARAIGHHLANWAADPEGVANGTGHDTTQLSDQDKTDGRVFTIVDGGFDLTDAVMRAVGMDPYQARKHKLLEETFDERAQIGANHRAAEYAASDQLMLRNLGVLWARADLSTAEKRAFTFELWDECAETGASDIVKAGALAREALLRYVDVHLPRGSADAFTDDEIAKLNAARKSTATFAPYQDK